MRRKRILDGAVIVMFVCAVFGLGWSLVGRSLELSEISENFENSVRQSELVASMAKNLSFNTKESRVVSLVFTGDIMLSRGVAYQIKKNNDFNYPFLKIADYLNSFDLAIGNLEGPISNRGENQGSIYSFRADPRVVEGLAYAGFDALSLANNHMLDWGREALIDTRELLESNGIKVAGAGRDYGEANEPAVFEVNGQKLAFLSYTDLYPKSLVATEEQAGISDSSIENIILKIEKLKKEGYLVVILMHWGEEYQAKSNLTQQKTARGFIDSGADLVIGHHPHVPQEIEEYRTPPSSETSARRGWIVYSLGNFVFDQNFSAETMKGQVVEVEITKGEVVAVSPREIAINASFQPEISK